MIWPKISVAHGYCSAQARRLKTLSRLLTYAYRAGASGYLAGRAIWLQPFSNFPDIATMEKELSETAPALMDQLNAMTR
ncbi:hypothetical protein [uncultured Cohaesibacter sp.]|uniref:hypothetical protein n=1 Tax=uncultured Cohaesibacter sp. TaxID=1002546 RepID=UPI0029C6BA2A|nr:hypothetical protein [uncultured Cohaesibacter sp.]